MSFPLIMGVDIGATKTHVQWCIGAAGGSRVFPTSDWRQSGNEADSRALLEQSFAAAGTAPAGLVVGANGCDTTGECLSFEAVLRRQLACPVKVVNDAELLSLAAGLPGAVNLVIGTGSIAVSRAADGAMLVAGGWGWVLGDEGSAAGLVREAARAARDGVDRGEPDHELLDALGTSLGRAEPSEFGRRLGRLRGAAEWGRHAEAVFLAAERGSLAAAQTIRSGARGLALLVERLAARGADTRHVVAGGSLIVGQPALHRLLGEELARRLPDTGLSVLRTAPVAGAVALARDLLAGGPFVTSVAAAAGDGRR